MSFIAMFVVFAPSIKAYPDVEYNKQEVVTISKVFLNLFELQLPE